MKVTPLDLRQAEFKKGMRGYDIEEVRLFLRDAADDYEAALREIDRLRQDVTRMETALAEHRDREVNLRNTLLTAQRLADQIREQADSEARLTVREAEGRAEILLQKAQVRLEEIGHEIGELRMRRRDVETTIEASIAALQNALEFVRTQDRAEITEVPRGPRRIPDGPATASIEPAPAIDINAQGASAQPPAAPATQTALQAVDPEGAEEILAQLRTLAPDVETKVVRVREFFNS